jgi:hypothetical protein
MTLIMEAMAVVCLLTAASLRFVFRQLTSRGSPLACEDDCRWLPFQQVTAERYSPMERLLEGRDFEYLMTRPEFNPERLRLFRAERRKMMRRYLSYLKRDHARVCAAIKMLMVQSAQDRPDLAAVLVRQRVIFMLGIMSVRFALSLHALGIEKVSVQQVIQGLDAIRVELESLVALQARESSMVFAESSHRMS